MSERTYHTITNTGGFQIEIDIVGEGRAEDIKVLPPRLA